MVSSNYKTVLLPSRFISQLENQPESGMGYHVVSLVMADNQILYNRIVINSELLKVSLEEDLDVNKIVKIELNKVINMSSLIIIRGSQNSGKTTTAGLVYQNLLKLCNPTHLFNDQLVEQNSLKYNEKGDIYDFRAVLDCNHKKIGIVSAGDFPTYLRTHLIDLLERKVDIIICCARSINRKGSTYRMIIDEFSKTNKISLEIFTVYAENKELRLSIKETVVERIINKVNELISK